MATPERERAEARISMSELLASCAAANAVSTPPRETQPEAEGADAARAVRPEAAPYDAEPENTERREAA